MTTAALSTTLRTRRPLAVLAWACAVITVVLLGAGSGFANASTPHLPVSLRAIAGGWYFRLTPVYAQAFAVVGALIVWRRPGNRVGWVTAAIGLLVGFEVFVAAYGNYARYVAPARAPLGWVAEWLISWVWLVPLLLMLVTLPLLFPDGRLISSRWRVLLFAPILTVGLVAAGTSTGISAIYLSGQFIEVGCLPATVACVVLRFRRADQEQRQQLVWFLAAVALVVVVAVAGTVVSFAVYHTNTVVFVPYFDFLVPLALTAIPVSIGIAVLAFHLYDIDVFLRRAIVYGALVAFIALLYVVVVVSVGTRIAPSSATDRAVPFALAAVVALAVQPLRTRLQRLANRLVYGSRATPYEALARFSRSVGELYSGDALPHRMARVMGEATDADRAEVWLRVGDVLRLSAAWPGTDEPDQVVPLNGAGAAIPGAQAAVPVVFQGEQLGALALMKREPLTPMEARLLNDLAHEAGLVLRNARLTAELTERLDELTASRQRLVTAQDAERRRLERDLHDGAQQLIVALRIKLGLARTLADRDPARLPELLETLNTEAGEALDTIRELARGIYPPILADSGLAAALRAHSRRVPLPVEIIDEGVGRHSQAVESAVYFCCLEALQNVAKHAAATRATVTLAERDGDLIFTVCDDGRGADPARLSTGFGMQNMRDRLAVAGGELRVESSPGRGTVLTGTVPVQSQVTSP